ncbi:MAG: beta-propeller domain-containing protein, partial [Pseudomonadota bacterium]|nr:beta-propeller domain-containing protein [Pseudomonadota bacterium]
VGQLPNSARPDEIGKPNEDLYGVRFVDNRAYLVTFERTDPLYTIDLSDPTDPYIVGELEVTGFSNFLHPVSDDLLLGLGQSADNRVKLELFDVSDVAAPVSRGVLTLGADLSWAYTAAEYDRHAFSYLVGDATDRLAIPLSGYVPTDANGWVARLQLIEVRDKAEADGAALMDAGYLSVQGLGPNEYPDGLSRSVLAGEAVFYINGTNVFSAFWNDPFNQTGPH